MYSRRKYDIIAASHSKYTFGGFFMKFKLTDLEKKWILYDIGNSAFIMLCTTIIPIYFNHLAEL